MTENEIRKIFAALVYKRNWYSGTSINRTQAWEIKNRFQKGELSTGRILEVLMECGYEIVVKTRAENK